MKKWRCTVCGYIHTGEEPPETCPVCGADRTKFVEVIDAAQTPAPGALSSDKPAPAARNADAAPPASGTPAGKNTADPAAAKTLLDVVTDLMVKHHLHPIAVHVPNGVVPAVILFVILGMMFTSASLLQAAFYNLIFVVLGLPVALYSGFNEWQKKYGGARTSIFIAKIIAAAVVTVCAVIIAAWYLFNPELIRDPSSMPGILIVLHLVLLLATGVAGHLGGKLVFKD